MNRLKVIGAGLVKVLWNPASRLVLAVVASVAITGGLEKRGVDPQAAQQAGQAASQVIQNIPVN